MHPSFASNGERGDLCFRKMLSLKMLFVKITVYI